MPLPRRAFVKAYPDQIVELLMEEEKNKRNGMAMKHEGGLVKVFPDRQT